MAELEKEMSKAGVGGMPPAQAGGIKNNKGSGGGGGAYVPAGAMPSQGTNTQAASHIT